MDGAPSDAAVRDARVGLDLAVVPMDAGSQPDGAVALDVGLGLDARIPSDGAAIPPDMRIEPPPPPPAARPPEPPPDGSAVVRRLARERPDLLASCAHDFVFELVRRLRGDDVRWGLVVRAGELEDDRVGYVWGEPPFEGSAQTYVVDVVEGFCPGPNDPPSRPGWNDDTAAGGTWTIAPLGGEPPPPPSDAGEPPPPDARVVEPMMRPLPDGSDVVDQLAEERPDLLAASCVEDGGNNDFLFEVVRRLRARDPRWGLNWKRGNVGDMSQDVVDYFYAPGDPVEGSTDVYIVDMIVGHCGPDPGPGWLDQTEATREAGTIGRWTIQPLN